MFTFNLEDQTRIERIDTPLPFGHRMVSYRWMGENSVAVIGYYDLPPEVRKVGTTFWLGDLHLIVVDDIYEGMAFYVAHFDGAGYQEYLYRRWRYALRGFIARLVLTAYVWGFATVPQYEVPTLKHLHRRRK